MRSKRPAGPVEGPPCREQRATAGARAEHGRVRGHEWSGETTSRLRAWAATTPRGRRPLLRARARAPGRVRRRWPRRDPRPGEFAPLRETVIGRDRRAPPGRPGDDRGPAAGDGPADAAVVPARISRDRRRAARPLAGDPAGLDRRARVAQGNRAARVSVAGGLCGGSRVAPLDALARAGGDDLRPAGAARRARAIERGRGSPPPRVDGRRYAAARLAGLAPGLAGECRSTARPTEPRGRGRGRAASGALAEPALRRPSSRCRDWRGWRCGRRTGLRVSLDRGAGGLRARRRDAAGRSAAGRSSEPRAASAASSARVSARRCCATAPMCRHCGPPRRWSPEDHGDLYARCGDAEAARRARRGDRARLEVARGRTGDRPPGAQRRTTPGRTYELLAARVTGWRAVELWFADERCVGPEDPESNYRMVRETLLSAAGPAARVHRIEGELGPRGRRALRASAARARAGCGGPGLPVLDVVVLGHRPGRPCRLAVPRCRRRCKPTQRDLPRGERLAQAATAADDAEPARAARSAPLPAAGDGRSKADALSAMLGRAHSGTYRRACSRASGCT